MPQEWPAINTGAGGDTVRDGIIRNVQRTETVRSVNSGTVFPTANLVHGMLCYRTDLDELYQLETVSPPAWVRLITQPDATGLYALRDLTNVTASLPPGAPGEQGEQGEQGDRGLTGMTGATGERGATGLRGGMHHNFSSITSVESPSSGTIRYDASVLADVTRIGINAVTSDGYDASAFHASWGGVSGPVQGTLVLLSGDPTLGLVHTFHVTEVTQSIDWTLLTVTPSIGLSSGTFGNNTPVVLYYTRNGDRGPQGIRGAPGPPGRNAPSPNEQCSCFLADELVRMADGTDRRHADVRVGEKILCMLTGPSTVLGIRTGHVRGNSMFTLRIGGKDLITTGEHSFLTADGRWVCAKKSERLAGSKGAAAVRSFDIGDGALGYFSTATLVECGQMKVGDRIRYGATSHAVERIIPLILPPDLRLYTFATGRSATVAGGFVAGAYTLNRFDRTDRSDAEILRMLAPETPGNALA